VRGAILLKARHEMVARWILTMVVGASFETMDQGRDCVMRLAKDFAAVGLSSYTTRVILVNATCVFGRRNGPVPSCSRFVAAASGTVTELASEPEWVMRNGQGNESESGVVYTSCDSERKSFVVTSALTWSTRPARKSGI
jgi:hypothetical protein